MNLNMINVAKASNVVKATVPSSVAEKLLSGQQQDHHAAAAGTLLHHTSGSSNPVEADVRREINRRIRALSESGRIFEEHAEYKDSSKDAEDAMLIVQVRVLLCPVCTHGRSKGDVFFPSSGQGPRSIGRCQARGALHRDQNNHP